MAIPDYQSLMLPLLNTIADGNDHVFREAVDRLADQFKLTQDERAELLPSGFYPVFANRVGWARTYMSKAGLIETPKRGTLRISSDGLLLLTTKPNRIDNKTLERYPSFIAFKQKAKDNKSGDEAATGSSPAGMQLLPAVEAVADLTPLEAIDGAYKRYRAEIESEMLDRLKSVHPTQFEEIVVELLVAMGYGGTRADAGRAIGKSGDGGIDGIINEDRLGLDVIYVQAKRWEGSVGRPEIQKFTGALHGQQASKGVFITTSTFTRDARDFTRGISLKIILIDGERLASLMVEHDVGVARIGSYVLKRLDNDYFDPA